VNRILVILNPAARGERAKSLRHAIEALSERVVVRETRQAGDAEAMAERGVAQGFRTIIAAGGDGTVNEVVNGIGEARVTLGILPVGTMNVFALELGIPGNSLRRAWDVIEEGAAREIDLPMANDEYFVQLAGVGLDAEVVRQTSPDSKKALGPVSYVLSLAQVAARKAPVIHAVDAAGKRHDGSFILVGNGRFYGGPLVLFRDAALDDGLLDVVVFKNQSHWDVIRYVQAIVFGTHQDLPDVEYFQTERLSVSSGTSVPVELDGEISGAVPFEFGFARRRLRVLCPRVDRRKRRK
jgi:YegS/Rv2252/BmrU family lipid kinase